MHNRNLPPEERKKYGNNITCIISLPLAAVLFGSNNTLNHKVRTYKEYHSVCPSSELGLSQPLSRQRVFPSPQKQGGGGTLACGWGVGGNPNSDEGHTLWYSLYVRTLCSELLQVAVYCGVGTGHNLWASKIIKIVSL